MTNEKQPDTETTETLTQDIPVNKWVVAVKIGNRPEFFAFPSEQERTEFIGSIPEGVEYATAFDEDEPTLKFSFNQV